MKTGLFILILVTAHRVILSITQIITLCYGLPKRAVKKKYWKSFCTMQLSLYMIIVPIYCTCINGITEPESGIHISWMAPDVPPWDRLRYGSIFSILCRDTNQRRVKYMVHGIQMWNQTKAFCVKCSALYIKPLIQAFVNFIIY